MRHVINIAFIHVGLFFAVFNVQQHSIAVNCVFSVIFAVFIKFSKQVFRPHNVLHNLDNLVKRTSVLSSANYDLT